jgi:hypothetical protein
MVTGLAKNQWFLRWIQGKALRADTESGNQRELDMFHNFLDMVCTAVLFLSFFLFFNLLNTA